MKQGVKERDRYIININNFIVFSSLIKLSIFKKAEKINLVKETRKKKKGIY